MVVEICVDSPASVAAAAAGGAARIELCAALSEGGLTPSRGLLREARRLFGGGIVIMIRPRSGDFLHGEAELRVMEDDIRLAREEGADEVIFGCLTVDGRIDEAACNRLLSACGPTPAAFHRAFDVSRDLPESLEILVRLGFKRVLTSGGRPTAEAGTEMIASLRAQAAGRITILPGGGIEPENAADLVRRTGVSEIHLGARRSLPSAMSFRREEVVMGASRVPGDYEHRVADAELIRSLVALRTS